MIPPETFTELARRLAREGAGQACDVEVDRLMVLAKIAPRPRARTLRRAALGLATAARLLARLGGPGPCAPFRPVGLRGAVTVGTVALAEGRLRQAELVGLAAFEVAPESPAALRLAAQALFAQGKYPVAAEALAAALQLDPLDRFTRALQAETLRLGDPWDVPWLALAPLRTLGDEAVPLVCALTWARRRYAPWMETSGEAP